MAIFGTQAQGTQSVHSVKSTWAVQILRNVQAVQSLLRLQFFPPALVVIAVSLKGKGGFQRQIEHCFF